MLRLLRRLIIQLQIMLTTNDMWKVTHNVFWRMFIDSTFLFRRIDIIIFITTIVMI